MERIILVLVGIGVAANALAAFVVRSRSAANLGVSPPAIRIIVAGAVATSGAVALLALASRVSPFLAVLVSLALAALTAAEAGHAERRHALRLSPALTVLMPSEHDTVQSDQVSVGDGHSSWAPEPEPGLGLGPAPVAATRETDDGDPSCGKGGWAPAGRRFGAALELAQNGRCRDAVTSALDSILSSSAISSSADGGAHGSGEELAAIAVSVKSQADLDFALDATLRLLIRPSVSRDAAVRGELVSFQRYLHSRRAALAVAGGNARINPDVLAVEAERRLAKIDSMLRR